MMLRLLALSTILGFAGAASLFANTTSKSTLPTTTTSSSVAASSCADPEDFDCLRPGPYGYPEILEGGYNIYEFEYSGSIASICSASFESSISQWEATAAITTFSQAYTGDTGGTSAYTTQYNVQFENFFSYSPVSPCCGTCVLYGGNVQVYYWPTPAPTLGVTELINSVNFTFTSPSVYVAFNSLYATDLCGHLGKDIPKTTIGFAPGALSTALAYQYDFSGPDYVYLGDNFTAADFGNEPKGCSNITTSFIINNADGSTYPYDQPLPSSVQSYCSISPESCDINSGYMTYNPCSPTLSVPSQLFTLNAAWKDCSQGIDAFFDPPYALSQGGALTAFNTPVDPTSSPTTSAQPQVTLNAPTPPPTHSPEPSPTPDPSPSAELSTSADSPASPNSSPSGDPSPSSDQPPPSSPSPSLNQNPSPAPKPSSSVNPSPSAGASASPNSSPSAGGSPNQSPYPSPNDTPTQGSATQPTTPIPFVLGTQTVSPGSPATEISGTTYSVPSSGGAVVINNSITQSIIQQTQLGQTGLDSSRTYVLGSQTLVVGGPAVTISSSIVVSLISDGESVVVEGSSTTETLAVTAAFPSTTGLGGIIVSIGGFTTATGVAGNGSATYTGPTVQGEGSRSHGAKSLTAILVGASGAVFGIMML